jgi:hypothetical protein
METCEFTRLAILYRLFIIDRSVQRYQIKIPSISRLLNDMLGVEVLIIAIRQLLIVEEQLELAVYVVSVVNVVH